MEGRGGRKMIFKKINTPGASGYLKENVTTEKI